MEDSQTYPGESDLTKGQQSLRRRITKVILIIILILFLIQGFIIPLFIVFFVDFGEPTFPIQPNTYVENARGIISNNFTTLSINTTIYTNINTQIYDAVIIEHANSSAQGEVSYNVTNPQIQQFHNSVLIIFTTSEAEFKIGKYIFSFLWDDLDKNVLQVTFTVESYQVIVDNQ